MNKRGYTVLRATVLIFSLLFVTAGIWQGELSVIMQKAVVVCLECIGIG